MEQNRNVVLILMFRNRNRGPRLASDFGIVIVIREQEVGYYDSDIVFLEVSSAKPSLTHKWNNFSVVKNEYCLKHTFSTTRDNAQRDAEAVVP
jgi:hypothetical protein